VRGDLRNVALLSHLIRNQARNLSKAHNRVVDGDRVTSGKRSIGREIPFPPSSSPLLSFSFLYSAEAVLEVFDLLHFFGLVLELDGGVGGLEVFPGDGVEKVAAVKVGLLLAKVLDGRVEGALLLGLQFLDIGVVCEVGAVELLGLAVVGEGTV
jgi:hypothetical protein